MHAYQFTHHSNVPKEPPVSQVTLLLEKAFDSNPLTRDEKDRIVEILYGVSGAHGSTYRRAGWAWPMHNAQQLHRILVSFEHGVFHAYYAPDKTSLRSALRYRGKILEMIDAPED